MALSNVQGKQVTRRTRVDSSGQGTSRHESDKGPSYYQKTSPKPRPSGQPPIHSPPPDSEAAQVEAHMEVNAGFGSPSSDQREASLVTSSAGSQTSAIGREACTREGRRTGREYAALADVPRARRISQRQAFDVERRRLEQRLRTRSPGRDEVERIFGQERRKVQAPAKFGWIEDQSRAGCNYNVAPRRGRSACRAEKGIHEKVYEPECASPKSISQRSRSLDRRSTKSTEVDLAGKAKRGWLARMDGDGQWLKNWFLLADNVLLYFRDSTGKEQSAADGEFELSSCCGVTEIQVHKGYGFQVQFEGSAIILAAATAGIRRSWMEDILRSIPGQPDRESCHPASSPSGADKALKQLLGQQSVNRPGALDNHIKTLDWSEFRTVRQALEKVSAGTQAHEKYNDWGDYLDLSSPEPPLKSVAWEAGQRVEQEENTVGVNHVTRTRCIPLADNTCTSTLFSHAAKQSMEIDASQTKTFGLNANLHPSNDTFKVSREEKSGGSSSILDSQRSPLPNSLNKPIPLRLVTVEGPSQFLPPTPIRKPGDGARTDGDKTVLGSTVLPRSHLHQKVKIWSGDANYGNACVDLVERPPPAGDEIEQHWEQVEKTPVNGQKQIAISCIRPSTPGSVGEAHYQALNEQVEKLQEELEQVRKELGLLQKEKCDLQTKLQQQKNLSGYISQVACERGLAAMQESHRIALAELQRQKDQELQAQREEQERLLVEEAAATAAALEVMQNAHRTELERVLQAQHSSSSSSSSERTDAFRRQQEELTSAQRELGVLSEQYSQKCLENSHLSQALEAERQALRHCQQENQALNAQNQKLNSRLSQELRRLRSIVTGDGDGKGQLATSTSPATYELEVMVRVKDSEIQYYKQEMNTLKEQLQAALREKKYAAEKYKDIYMEMSIVRAKAEMDAGRLQEKLVAARRGLPQDVMRTESNPDFPRIEDANVSPRPVDSCHHQSLGERNNLRELYYQEKEE